MEYNPICCYICSVTCRNLSHLNCHILLYHPKAAMPLGYSNIRYGYLKYQIKKGQEEKYMGKDVSPSLVSGLRDADVSAFGNEASSCLVPECQDVTNTVGDHVKHLNDDLKTLGTGLSHQDKRNYRVEEEMKKDLEMAVAVVSPNVFHVNSPVSQRRHTVAADGIPDRLSRKLKIVDEYKKNMKMALQVLKDSQLIEAQEFEEKNPPQLTHLYSHLAPESLFKRTGDARETSNVQFSLCPSQELAFLRNSGVNRFNNTNISLDDNFHHKIDLSKAVPLISERGSSPLSDRMSKLAYFDCTDQENSTVLSSLPMLHRDIQELKCKCALLIDENSMLLLEKNCMQSKLGVLEKDNKRLIKELCESVKDMDALIKHQREMSKEVASLRSQADTNSRFADDQLNLLNGDFTSEKRRLNNEIDRVTSAKDWLQFCNIELEQRALQCQKQLSVLKRSITVLKSEKRSLQKLVSKLEEQHQEASQQRDNEILYKEKLKEFSKALDDKLDQIENQKKKFVKKFCIVKEEKKRLKHELAESRRRVAQDKKGYPEMKKKEDDSKKLGSREGRKENTPSLKKKTEKKSKKSHAFVN